MTQISRSAARPTASSTGDERLARRWRAVLVRVRAADDPSAALPSPPTRRRARRRARRLDPLDDVFEGAFEGLLDRRLQLLRDRAGDAGLDLLLNRLRHAGLDLLAIVSVDGIFDLLLDGALDLLLDGFSRAAGRFDSLLELSSTCSSISSFRMSSSVESSELPVAWRPARRAQDDAERVPRGPRAGPQLKSGLACRYCRPWAILPDMTHRSM